VFDLAAHKSNCVVPDYYGPDREEPGMRNSLSPDSIWQAPTPSGKPPRANLWLNPPFDTIAPWAEKCAATSGFTQSRTRVVWQRVLFLVPASVGSEWFAKFCDGEALVLFLRPRLSFDGKNPYPKDCLLAVYGVQPGYECWKWTT
jgi:hypothetical protein